MAGDVMRLRIELALDGQRRQIGFLIASWMLGMRADGDALADNIRGVLAAARALRQLLDGDHRLAELSPYSAAACEAAS